MIVTLKIFIWNSKQKGIEREKEREKHKDTLLVPIFGKYMKEVLIKRR